MIRLRRSNVFGICTNQRTLASGFCCKEYFAEKQPNAEFQRNLVRKRQRRMIPLREHLNRMIWPRRLAKQRRAAGPLLKRGMAALTPECLFRFIIERTRPVSLHDRSVNFGDRNLPLAFQVVRAALPAAFMDPAGSARHFHEQIYVLVVTSVLRRARAAKDDNRRHVQPVGSVHQKSCLAPRRIAPASVRPWIAAESIVPRTCERKESMVLCRYRGA